MSGETITLANFRESPTIAALPTRRIGLQLAFDRLRRDVLAAAGLEQLLLAVGDERNPSSSLPMSPVLNQPSSVNSFFVSSSRFQ
jgi:hypothetical protein